MLRKLKDWFSSPPAADAARDPRALHLASAILLFEIAKSDHHLDQQELDRLEQVLRDQWSLADDELLELLDVAKRESDISASLHQQLDLVNRHFSREDKIQLLQGMWSVAGADGKLHHHEEHLIRRLADLMYVAHKDFIRSKHRALGD